MTDDLLLLASRLDAAVRQVPGVTTVFAADAALVRTARQLTVGTEPLPLVSVAASDDGVAVIASVGVTGGELAPVTAAIVAAAIRSVLPIGVDATVAVRVSRIAG
jgi:hypothetical protein